MKSKIVLFLCLGCFLFPSLFAQTPSVLIIGGGPCGLATAIEARQAGYGVTVVEKRAIHERRQRLFLLEPTLQLLKKWEVDLASMIVIDGEEFGALGIVPIKDLEVGLEKRALALGVQKIQGEFTEFHGVRHEAIIATEAGDRFLPYDFIIAADGVHSSVRKALGIQPTRLGEATGSAVFIPLEAPQAMDISPIVQKNGFFVRKISLETGSLVFIQGPSKNAFLEKHWQKTLKACGWNSEAKALDAKKASFADGIPIVLSQASHYSDEPRKALLVGDAAATASFLQGMGANTGLKTAALAGDFFKSKTAGEPSAYQSFEEGMQVVTDALIEDSRCLFP